MLQLHFLKENCRKLIVARDAPLACTVLNMIEDLRSYILAGTTKEQFRGEPDRLLAKLGQTERRKMVKSFQTAFWLSLSKLDSHLQNLLAYDYYKVVRIFDPRQLPCLCEEFLLWRVDLHSSWGMADIYAVSRRVPANLSRAFIILGEHERTIPQLSVIASDAIWVPVSPANVECSFSQYKHLLNDRWESLTEDNTRGSTHSPVMRHMTLWVGCSSLKIIKIQPFTIST